MGLNESGKTTILEAIDWFSGGRESLDPAGLAGRTRANNDDLVPIADKANFNGKIIIRAGVELDDEDIQALAAHLKKRHKYDLKEVTKTEFVVEDVNIYRDSTWFKREEPQPLAIEGIGRSQRGTEDRKLSQHKQAAATAQEFIRTRMPPIWYFPNFLFDFPSRIYLSERDDDTDRDRFYRALMQDVLDSLDKDASLDRHIVKRATSNSSSKQRALKQLLLDMQRAITNRIFTPWDGIFGQENDKEVVLTHDYDAFENAEGEEFYEVYLEFQIKGNDGYFDVSERSLGFRWFFVFLLLTHFRGFRKGSSDVLFLFDEPASNLHPNAQAKLLESFSELTDRCVIIYTTHSHHMINPRWLENTFVVRNLGLEVETSITDYNARKTNIVVDRYRSFAVEHPEQSHYFRPILDVLDYAPSRLEAVPDAVMLEGKNDFYALSYLQDLILQDVDTDLALMPGMGAGGLDSLIQLYLGWGRNFIVVLDSDQEGERQRKRYLDKFGAVLDGKVFTLKVFVSKAPGHSPETLLTKADRLAIQGIAYPGEDYTKKKFYRSLQEALATGSVVPIGEPTQRRFQRILEGMALALDDSSQFQ